MIYNLSSGAKVTNLILTMFVSIMPAVSIFSIADQGLSVLHTVSPGRFELPRWLLYSIGWLVFFYFARVSTVPFFQYVNYGHVISIGEDKLETRGIFVKREDILYYEKTIFGPRLVLRNGFVYVHPHMSEGAASALDNFLHN